MSKNEILSGKRIAEESFPVIEAAVYTIAKYDVINPGLFDNFPTSLIFKDSHWVGQA